MRWQYSELILPAVLCCNVKLNFSCCTSLPYIFFGGGEWVECALYVVINAHDDVHSMDTRSQYGFFFFCIVLWKKNLFSIVFNFCNIWQLMNMFEEQNVWLIWPIVWMWKSKNDCWNDYSRGRMIVRESEFNKF